MTKRIVGTNSSFNHRMVKATEVRMKTIAVDKRSESYAHLAATSCCHLERSSDPASCLMPVSAPSRLLLAEFRGVWPAAMQAVRFHPSQSGETR